MDKFMEAAIQEARDSHAEGGMPIGSVLVLEGKIIGRGRNQKEQRGSVILHAEMDAIENAGIRHPEAYQKMVLYTTLSPCPMCSGAVIFLGIPKVVIADNTTMMGAEGYLREQGIVLEYQRTDEVARLLVDYRNKRTSK